MCVLIFFSYSSSHCTVMNHNAFITITGTTGDSSTAGDRPHAIRTPTLDSRTESCCLEGYPSSRNLPHSTCTWLTLHSKMYKAAHAAPDVPDYRGGISQIHIDESLALNNLAKRGNANFPQLNITLARVHERT